MSDYITDRFPGIDPRFKADRKGSGLDLAAALAKHGLTEDETFDLLEGIGVDKLYRSLKPEVLEPVNNTLAGLWQINRLGLSVEQNDEKTLGKVDLLREHVNQDLEQTRIRFHKGDNDWFKTSVRSLIEVSSGAQDGRDSKIGDLLYLGDDYIGRLGYVAKAYVALSSSINDQSEREGVMKYVGGDRQSDLWQMNKLLIHKVHENVPHILKRLEDKK